ncbi:MAG: hypothetical protein ACREM9_00250, partial [Gemmatimonadales bacterium]
MIPSQTMSLKLLAAAGLLLVADPGRELRVLRVAPAEEAAPTSAVTVTFDRPVAGSLDRTVDPGALFRIQPAVPGEVDWRDPVTLRFRPYLPLPANGGTTTAGSTVRCAGSLLQVLRGAGFGSLGRSADHYGLGLALGNGDVTLLELANGFRGLVNLGVWRPYTWRVGSAGQPAGPGRRFASERSAALVLDILADPVAR